VRLPDAALREAEVKVLPDVPGRRRFHSKVQTHNISVDAIGEEHCICLGRGDETRDTAAFVSMEHNGSHGAHKSIQTPDNYRRGQEAMEFLPMAYAGADINHCEDVMRFVEEFVASKSNNGRKTEDIKRE